MEPRRSMLTEVKRREICAILAVGCSRIVAARCVGCHVNTIRNTALKDPEFAEALEQAETQQEIRHLSNINTAAKDARYWRAAAWALERTNPDRYGRRRPRTVTVDQISAALSQMAEAILEEVTELEQQERVLARLTELTAELQTPGAKGTGA